MESSTDLLLLLERIAAQDATALSEFYEATADQLFALSITILKDRHEAQDSLQETFLKIWKNAQSYKPTLGSPLSWAVTVTRNTAFDRYRKRRRQAEQHRDSQTDLTSLTESTTGLQADDFLTQDESCREILKALATLNPDQRQAIELTFFSGQTHQEISDNLGIPLGTIKARIRRGMQSLRPHLKRPS